MHYLSSGKKAEELSRRLSAEYGTQSFLVKCDLICEKDIKNMANIVLEKYKKVDVLINNAAFVEDKEFPDRTWGDFETTLKTNVVAPFLLSQTFGKVMAKNKGGNIINISSTNADNTIFPTSVDYDASKAALNNLTRNLAIEFAPHVNVNAVAPGWVNTPMNKELPKSLIKDEAAKILKKRFAEPSEIADVVYYLTTPGANFINGTVITIDGGKF